MAKDQTCYNFNGFVEIFDFSTAKGCKYIKILA
jgi:hypothetical protein